MESLLQAMKYFGFTEMETKVYVSLLEFGPSTGYEISKKSGVPRSKVYNILEKLVKEGIIFDNHADIKLYTALSVEEMLLRIDNKTEKQFQQIEHYLSRITEKQKSYELWKVDHLQSVIEKVHFLINHANESLLIQIWEPDLTEEIVQLLQKAEERLNVFILILFSDNHHYDLPLKHYYKHGFEQAKRHDMGGRWINIIADDDSVLFGTLEDNINIIWTHHPAMLSLAKEYIKHDAYTLKIIEDHREMLEKTYGPDLGQIREI
ncbi:UNVERIFIED_CONTAM: TrmB family transcriptional regulator [Streptococcus canis]|uniref:Uncharacterized protein n=2 Tax=Streptococcus canis TaxID=1329 RepID=A0A2D4DPN0_STRCB|nr:TrmB family transcriptional regulator [Streptococcus canis]EIQ82293.1 hypothetical protein SCAZ3_08020 [Streptococcus canis FSL Z3-227]MDV5973792.1 TrmB family transcriptional regulator [Streptococcus canis]MDV5988183.1 TrmB family transcriptional regulator [Streptococcus canis]MDV5994294.1 TrmB family transcriptional regulator [Streptococcus canis]MDV6001141.1 TrmB family transcriptional regulator [Streptococcus canis]